MIRDGGEAVPVEVKSAENRRAKSMRTLLERGDVRRGIKLSTANRGSSDGLVTYPLYLAPFIAP